ncbi:MULTISPECIES: O-methyltransferase [Ectothiorhodospira]|uniref:Predicted O-methyltransferase YrrM n=1 Tax=Ectothiorhodospira marina TaxID=1396821 RepID=A0A1H7GZ52_9GAMM|nr:MULTISPECIES: class I SAM-dependent methyltransferase [Ectothiorhodospira]MCG5515634.1 class I SAM-dependent methyltransferase [Ectothiorhodospira sp. 9100]MCG5518842.1 class I SAM-dependent methyltransferase [Ectothiorhodospira sp. 9905]SEK43299.1 Predicted O-methyltransferase YrrM [Ectothiorhodospira marina]
MSNLTTPMDERLQAYMRSVTLREPALYRCLREETAHMPEHNLQVAPEQGQFLGLLVELLGARRILEIGTFTGYSALWMAGAMPEDGELVCCDISEEWTAIARRYWAEAGLADRIDLRLAPALDTLDGLLADGQAGHFDLAFIDADKANYVNYYRRCLRLMRPGGVVCLDNTLWGGRVADPNDHEPDTESIRAFNALAHEDPNVTLSLLPIGDGLTLARKR